MSNVTEFIFSALAVYFVLVFIYCKMALESGKEYKESLETIYKSSQIALMFVVYLTVAVTVLKWIQELI